MRVHRIGVTGEVGAQHLHHTAQARTPNGDRHARRASAAHRHVGPLVGGPIDQDQRTAEDRVGQSGGSAHRGGEVVGAGGEQVDGLAQVVPDGGNGHLEAGREAGERVTVALGSTSSSTALLPRASSYLERCRAPAYLLWPLNHDENGSVSCI